MDRRLEITRLIHDNFGLVMTYAFSKPVVTELLESKFEGEWKYLWRSFGLGELRADRALLEMATQLRILDDIDYQKQFSKSWSDISFGHIVKTDGAFVDLTFRQMTNKIIHAATFD